MTVASLAIDPPGAAEAPVVGWTQRARALRAMPVDAARGTALFEQHWRAERHGVALTPAEMADLAACWQVVTVPAGAEVIGQDEQGDYLVLLLEGRIAVERIQAKGARIRLAQAHPGEILGDMAVLDAGARLSSCIALVPCTIAVLEADRLDGLVAGQPRLAVAVLASLARRLSLRLRQVSARLSALLSDG